VELPRNPALEGDAQHERHSDLAGLRGTLAMLRSCVVLATVLISAAVSAMPARGAEASHVTRIGVLNPQTASESLEEALRQGLKQLGYVEGRNIAIEWRRGAGGWAQMRSLAAELVDARVDLIVSMGTPATKAALDSTTKPIVFFVGDPVGSHFARSLARPGGNATGVSVVYPELITKHLELLRELLPSARRMIFLTNLSNPGPGREALTEAAGKLGVELVTLSASNAGEIDAALNRISRKLGEAVLVSGDLFLLANRHKIAKAVRQARLPAMFPFRQYHEAGVLMSYGPDYATAMGQVASYVDRIVKGADPGQLPIEQVSKYELVVNVRLARELHIQIPQAIVARADELIK
jgi:putative ABC transport system substrate-binding protein